MPIYVFSFTNNYEKEHVMHLSEILSTLDVYSHFWVKTSTPTAHLNKPVRVQIAVFGNVAHL